jgi:hypothetical protein
MRPARAAAADISYSTHIVLPQEMRWYTLNRCQASPSKGVRYGVVEALRGCAPGRSTSKRDAFPSAKPRTMVNSAIQLPPSRRLRATVRSAGAGAADP